MLLTKGNAFCFVALGKHMTHTHTIFVVCRSIFCSVAWLFCATLFYIEYGQFNESKEITHNHKKQMQNRPFFYAFRSAEPLKIHVSEMKTLSSMYLRFIYSSASNFNFFSFFFFDTHARTNTLLILLFFRCGHICKCYISNNLLLPIYTSEN